jgi:hypothetical protein
VVVPALQDRHISWSPDARAALLRDESGELVGTTWGGTVCWFPRRPRQFAAVERDTGAESVLRCGFCAGCRELERQWLCARLCEKYQSLEEELWLIVVDAPQSEHASISRSLLRRRKLRIERALYRLGSDSCAFLTRGAKPTIPSSLALRFKVAVHRVRKSRGKRAWALLTAGMLRPRDDYGEWVNRFYHRGLPPRPREFHFAVATRGGISRRHATSRYARAWKDGIAIEPPAAWRLPRLNKRKGPERRRPAHAASVDEILAQIFERAAGQGGAAPITHGRARSARPSLNDRISDRPRATGQGAVHSTSAQRAALPKDADYRTSILNRGSGYRGSLQSWVDRMNEIARKRGGQDDG